MTKLLIPSLLLAAMASLLAQDAERVVKAEVIAPASLEQVWQAWTTVEGLKSFFAPACKVDLRVGGAYEMYFNPAGAPGERGGEGNAILAIQPQNMLAFTWNAPPSLPNVRRQHTSVVVRFKEIAPGQTKVTLVQSGWGAGEEWDKAFAYFNRAWPEIVLPRLQHRFAKGPIDWNNPPDLTPRNQPE